MKRTILIVVACCVFVAIVFTLSRQRPVEEEHALAPQPAVPIQTIERKVYYGFTLTNRTNRLLKKAELWCYGPARHTSTQRCVDLDASHPYRLITDVPGNQVLHFELEDLAPFGATIVRIEARLEMTDALKSVHEHDLATYLDAERFIESDDPAITGLVKRFGVMEPGPAAKGIYRWITTNIHPSSYEREDRGALDALTNRKGDCTEQAYLFAALARAQGIPARVVGGYRCDRDCILTPSEYHNWAEFHGGGAWHLADPQGRVFGENPSRYIAMEILGPSADNPMGLSHRFRYQGEGLEVRMEW